jgi:hypothetical protein
MQRYLFRYLLRWLYVLFRYLLWRLYVLFRYLLNWLYVLFRLFWRLLWLSGLWRVFRLQRRMWRIL